MFVLYGKPQQHACSAIHTVYLSVCQGNLGASYGKEP